MIGIPEINLPSDSGKAMLYFGSNQMDSIPDKIFEGNDIYFGIRINNAKDINKDGNDDFIISSNYYAYIFFEPDSFIIINASKWGYGGDTNVGTGGDINNDGFFDFLIGNNNFKNNLDVMVGVANVYLCSTTIDTICDYRLIGETKWGQFSQYMSIIGDVNNDGYDEFLISAPLFPDHENPLGKVYIYSLKKITKISNNLNNTYISNFKLMQNTPNPFNPSTKIKFTLPKPETVKIEVYNIIGQKIQTLLNQPMPAGHHEVEFNGKNLPSGVYLYRIEAGAWQDVKKMVLLQ